MTCAHPCATCPWLRTNQTAEALARSPKAKGARLKWYDPLNLKRLWGGIRRGHSMICHATDSHAPEYGGKEAAPGHERMCIGALVLVQREINAYERCCKKSLGSNSFLGYRLHGGNRRMTQTGMLAWAERIMFAGSMLGPSRQLLPKVVEGDGIGVPWDDAIGNSL